MLNNEEDAQDVSPEKRRKGEMREDETGSSNDQHMIHVVYDTHTIRIICTAHNTSRLHRVLYQF